MGNNVQSLTQVFGKYTDQIILNPKRITCDVDMVVASIREEAAEHGLELQMEYPDHTAPTDVRDDRLRVSVKDDGGILKVAGFTIG